MKEPLLTIGMCVYNGEAYLHEALDSIFQQNIDLATYEVICVDDCSHDSSVEILQEYAAKYPNMTCILHETNKKTGTGCNEILRTAKGKYLWYIGQDDYIEQGAVDTLLNQCEAEQLDVLCFNYKRVYSSGEVLQSPIVFDNVAPMKGKDYLHTYFEDNFHYYLLGYEWRALVRLDLLREKAICFKDGVIWEDTTFLFKAMYHAARIGSVKDSYYNYRVNENSVGHISSKYKATTIYEYAFMIGHEVREFADTIRDDSHFYNILSKVAQSYFDSFAPRIIYTSMDEKRKFYSLVRQNQLYVKNSLKYSSGVVRLLAHPYMGIVFATSLMPMYILKRKIQDKSLKQN